MNKWIAFIATVALVSSARVGLAAPQKVDVPYRVHDLAAGVIDAPQLKWTGSPVKSLELLGTDCKMELKFRPGAPASATIQRAKGKCNTFWEDQTPQPRTLSVTSTDLKDGGAELKLLPVAPTNDTPFELKASEPKKLEAPAGTTADAAIVVRLGDEWKTIRSEATAGKRFFDVGLLAPGTHRAFTNFLATGAPGYALASLVVPVAAAPAVVTAAPSPASATLPPPSSTKDLLSDFCKQGDADPKYLVCIDLLENTTVFKARDGDSAAKNFVQKHIMLPNSGLLVRVRHDKDSKIAFELGGERGLFASRIVKLVPEGSADALKMEKDIVPAITSRSFGPRLPGAADLTVTQTDGKGNPSAINVELVVEETYAGAIRLGIASIFGNAVNRSYAARHVNGSQQAEVVATSANSVDFELVLGTAPYLFDYLFMGGPRPAITAGPRFAPYFGIGLISLDPEENADLAFLSSMHFGLELEFVPSFSVAGTAVIRKVTRLSGAEVGSPVNDNEIPTETATGVGFGLVVNFSPDFFKVAGKGAGGLL